MELQSLFHFAQTFSPIDKGDPFIVIFRKDSDLALGLRLTEGVVTTLNGSLWVSILGVLCTRNRDTPMTPVQAMETFGGFEFKMKNGECISESICPLVAFPCSPAEVFNASLRLRPQLESNYIEQLIARLASGGNVLCIPEQVLQSMLRARLDDLIPELEPTENSIPRFLFLGESSTGKSAVVV